jgi:hypothetical protein
MKQSSNKTTSGVRHSALLAQAMNKLPDHLAALIQMFIAEPFMAASVRKSLGSRVPNILTLGRRGDVLRGKLAVCRESFQRNETGKNIREVTKK